MAPYFPLCPCVSCICHTASLPQHSGGILVAAVTMFSPGREETTEPALLHAGVAMADVKSVWELYMHVDLRLWRIWHGRESCLQTTHVSSLSFLSTLPPPHLPHREHPSLDTLPKGTLPYNVIYVPGQSPFSLQQSQLPLKPSMLSHL